MLPYKTFSIDEQRLNENKTTEEVCLVDMSVDIEREVIDKLDREILLDALSELEESEMEMIIKMFLSDEILNGEEYGKIIGQSRKEVSKKKEKNTRFFKRIYA